MKRWLRYGIFIITTGILIVGTLLALLLVRGNTLTPGGITQTGTIRLDVSPTQGFSVFLNEQKQNLTSNSTVENITPGEYTVRIVRTGYAEWQQPVEVQAGLVTTVSAKLFPESLQLDQITKSNISEVFFSASRRYAFYIVTDSPLGSNVGIWRQSLVPSGIPLIEERAVKITNITPAIASAIAAQNLRLLPTEDGSKILLILGAAIHLLDAGSYNEPSASNLINLSYQVDSIAWLNQASNLVIRSGNLLADYNIADVRTTVISYTNDTTPVFAVRSNSVYYYAQNQLWKYSGGTSRLIDLENISLPAGTSEIITPEANENILILKASNSYHYLYLSASYIKDLGAVEILTVSPNGQLLITKDPTGALASIELDISLVQNSAEVKTKATTLPTTLDASTITWDTGSRFFIFKQTSISDSLFSADRYGENITTLLTSENILTGKNYNITPNGENVIILLSDNNEGSTRQNLYQLSLID